MFLQQTDSAFSDQEISTHIDQALAIQPPLGEYERLYRFVKVYFDPTVVGLDNIPDKPTLFVGNHALFGIDAFIMVPMVLHKTGRFLRGLADQLLFQLPIGDHLMKRGVVLANPKVCSALMKAGEDVLVFPGGSFESTKPETEKYSLLWRERHGFVRMAAEHGYDITPFGMVGPDDCYDHYLEGAELLETWPGKWLSKMGLTDDLRKDIIPPVSLGLLNTPMPKPQPSFLAFGDPIHVPPSFDEEVPLEVLTSVREETAARIDQLIGDMLLLRSQQKPGWLRRWFI